jgi:hypothetical protein
MKIFFAPFVPFVAINLHHLFQSSMQRLIPVTPQSFVTLNRQSGKPLTLKRWVYRIGGVQEKLPPLLTSQANSGGK